MARSFHLAKPLVTHCAAKYVAPARESKLTGATPWPPLYHCHDQRGRLMGCRALGRAPAVLIILVMALPLGAAGAVCAQANGTGSSDGAFQD